MKCSRATVIATFSLVTFCLSYEIPPNHILWGMSGEPVGGTSTEHTFKSKGATKERRADRVPSLNGSSSSTSIVSSVSGSTPSRVPDRPCINGPTSRDCWAPGFSVATDFDSKWPETGQTVYYTLELTNETCAPDGTHPRPCLLFNKQLPGPTIEANWGDMVSVTVKNSASANGTGVHWHGIRQYGSNVNDGVGGITECPIAPGESKTYTFRATQFGSTWYHSHFSAQYGEGAAGAFIIHGPASANYDVDLGSYTISDYYYKGAFQIQSITNANLQRGTGPPPADTVLINGTNKSPTGQGQYDIVTMEKGKKYRLRLINTSLDNNIRVSLDGHPFTVITTDMVPIQPYATSWILLAVGQRYEVVIDANQTAGNYWFRAEAAVDCASANEFYGRSIFSYNGSTSDLPQSTGSTAPSQCVDESPLVPWVQNTVPQANFASQVQSLDVDLAQEQITTNGKNIVVWGVNVTAIDIAWDRPTLEYVVEKNTSYPSVYNLIEIPNPQTWTYWIVQETPGTLVPIPHPIHLHGHDFYVLGQGSGLFDKSTAMQTLKFANPVRRDTAILPGRGWLALAFPSDNPGAWLMHCHIAWHVGAGLGVQFLESKSQIVLPDSQWQETCAQWKSYWSHSAWPQIDSGL